MEKHEFRVQSLSKQLQTLPFSPPAKSRRLSSRELQVITDIIAGAYDTVRSSSKHISPTLLDILKAYELKMLQSGHSQDKDLIYFPFILKMNLRNESDWWAKFHASIDGPRDLAKNEVLAGNNLTFRQSSHSRLSTNQSPAVSLLAHDSKQEALSLLENNRHLPTDANAASDAGIKFVPAQIHQLLKGLEMTEKLATLPTDFIKLTQDSSYAWVLGFLQYVGKSYFIERKDFNVSNRTLPSYPRLRPVGRESRESQREALLLYFRSWRRLQVCLFVWTLLLLSLAMTACYAAGAKVRHSARLYSR